MQVEMHNSKFKINLTLKEQFVLCNRIWKFSKRQLYLWVICQQISGYSQESKIVLQHLLGVNITGNCNFTLLSGQTQLWRWSVTQIIRVPGHLILGPTIAVRSSVASMAFWKGVRNGQWFGPKQSVLVGQMNSFARTKYAAPNYLSMNWNIKVRSHDKMSMV